jgi:hypothetical protein
MTARSTARIAVLLAVAALPATLVAAVSPEVRCRAAKVKAAGQKVLDKARCQQRALLKSAAVDPACITKAETKFAAAIAKADAKGPCLGTVIGLEATVDQCVDSILIVGLEPVCCTAVFTSGQRACWWAADAPTCEGMFGVAGAPGSVCDSVTGDCVDPPANAGPCCPLGGTCSAGPAAFTSCGPNGTMHVTGICTPAGICEP